MQYEDDAAVRFEALCSLEKIVGKGDRRVVSALLVALRDPDQEVCYRAVEAIAKLHEHVPGDLAVVIAISQMLMENSGAFGWMDNRKAALQALIATGIRDEALVAVLAGHFHRLRDGGSLESCAAERRLLLEALHCVTPEECKWQLVDVLVASLDDYASEVRLAALQLLATLGEPHTHAVAERLRDRHPDVKFLASQMLAEWGCETPAETQSFRNRGTEYRLGE
ncbi:unnamed protein product [Effrenium voratum]|nr:unnamed protein product [Effrenium voratum]